MTDLPFAILRSYRNRYVVQVAAQLSRSYTGCPFVIDTPFGIACDLALTPRIVRRALRSLEKGGWIAIDPRPCDGKSVYWLRWRLPIMPAGSTAVREGGEA